MDELDKLYIVDWEGTPVEDILRVDALRPGISMLTVRSVIQRTLAAPPTPVQVNSVEDMMHWLKTCAYVSDEEYAGTSEDWQTPWNFERSRRGDCEDHALWAWRKCLDLSLPARFAYGFGPTGAGHAWVQMHGTLQYVLETTEKNAEPRGMIPVSEVCGRYRAAVSVNGQGLFFRHEFSDGA